MGTERQGEPIRSIENGGLHDKGRGNGGERKGWQVLVQEVAAWAYDRKGQSSVVANTRLGALATV